MAGYEEQIKKCFFSVNPGLERRFQWIHRIEEYNSSHLAEMCLQKIKETLCHEGTTYKGNSGTYMFIEGKTTSEGTINGVVKKLDDTGVAKTA